MSSQEDLDRDSEYREGTPATCVGLCDRSLQYRYESGFLVKAAHVSVFLPGNDLSQPA